MIKDKLILPNFLCVGAQKAGTTTLQDILIQHPSIYLSNQKEIKYFHRDEHYSKGLNWYSSFFVDAKTNQIVGDITPDYILYNNSAKRIYDSLGANVKLIFLLRNPIDRLYSHFNFHKVAEVEKETSFNKMIEKYGSIDKENKDFINWYMPNYYIERGLYFNQIERFLKYFKKEQMHFILFEDFIGAKKEKEIDKLCDFLQVKRHNLDTNVHSHSTRLKKDTLSSKALYKLKRIKILIKPILPEKLYLKLKGKLISSTTEKAQKLSNEMRKKILANYYIEDIQKLELFLDKDLSSWKNIK